MNYNRLESYIEQYKARFDEIHLDEIYKWKAFKCFQDNWDINSSEFVSMLEKSLDKTANLLVSGNYWPKLMLLETAETNADEVQELFHQLVDEEMDLSERINEFRDGINRINESNFPGRNPIKTIVRLWCIYHLYTQTDIIYINTLYFVIS